MLLLLTVSNFFRIFREVGLSGMKFDLSFSGLPLGGREIFNIRNCVFQFLNVISGTLGHFTSRRLIYCLLLKVKLMI